MEPEESLQTVLSRMQFTAPGFPYERCECPHFVHNHEECHRISRFC
jgi:hypothetical protein